MSDCTRPPDGWRCTRQPGHDGPCAAVPTTTLEDYLRREISRAYGDVTGGTLDFRVRASFSGPVVTFYIHPAGRDGETRDFVVTGDTLSHDPRVQPGGGMEEIQAALSKRKAAD